MRVCVCVCVCVCIYIYVHFYRTFPANSTDSLKKAVLYLANSNWPA